MLTAAPNVYAVGDVVAGTPQLAHVGFAEAIVAIKTILGEPAMPVDYDRVPWAIYSNPEVAFVGLTEGRGERKGLRRRGEEGPLWRKLAGPNHRGHRRRRKDHRGEARRRFRRADSRVHMAGPGSPSNWAPGTTP